MISYESMREFVRSNEGTEFVTDARGNTFTCTLQHDAILITRSTGGQKRATEKRIKMFCDRFNQTRSFAPGPYHPWTAAASQLVVLARLMLANDAPALQEAAALEHLGGVQPSHTRMADAPLADSSAVGAADEVSVAEGRELLRLHRTRERSQGLIVRKKQSVLFEFGRLACEACDFDFAAVYGSRGDGFAECHHTQPISQSAPGRRTRLSELAVVCANCHRMLHRRPWVSVPELQALVRLRRGG